MINNNTYGIVRQALINPETDVDIYYHYRPTRNLDTTDYRYFTKVSDVSSMLSNSEVETTDYDVRLPGMYTLKMPTSIFNRKGFYTVYIVPKEIRCSILDVGALAAFPNIRGIVVDINSLQENRDLFKDGNLVGYRVEYYEYDGKGLNRQDYYRVVTSNNLCATVSQNLVSANTNSNGYRFTQSGSLSFITLTPSTAPTYKANATPYIGVPNQVISFVSTKFDPVCVEIEMTEHDFDTLSYMLEGNVVRNLDTEVVTHYNDNNEIYKQFDFFRVKDTYTNTEVAEVKMKRDTIDNSIDINNYIE